MTRCLVALLCATVVTALGCGSGATSESGQAPGDTMLASAFPLTSVVRAAEMALPSDVAIGPIPMDVRWLPGNRIEVPVERAGQQAVLVVTVLPDQQTCAAESEVLDPGEQADVADKVCEVWAAEGRLPVVVPDPDAPVVVDPSDAAR